jgi:hypothetical protein
MYPAEQEHRAMLSESAKDRGTTPHQNEIGDVCAAMFLAAARSLGFNLEGELTMEAQRKILFAAAHLVEGMRELIEHQVTIVRARELGN